MKLICCLTGLVFLISIAGCSSSIKPIKASVPTNEPAPIAPSSQTSTEKTEITSRSSQVDENLIDTSWDQERVIQLLNHDLRRYREANGSLPDSLNTLVNSGFLLWWPRNLFTGSPAKVIKERELEPNMEDLGLFKYNIISNPAYDFSLNNVYNYNYHLELITINSSEYYETGNPVWKKVTKNYPGYKLEDNVTRVIGVPHGKKPTYEISDYNKRLLYALCGNFAFYIQYRVALYHRDNSMLPSSFSDLLNDKQYIIKENFIKFADLLKNSGATFKWGIDYSTGASYVTLEIDGETYMSGCRMFGDKAHAHVPDYGEYFGCDVNNIDMSSPIITNENIANLIIPEQYLISISQIPLNE